jgi:hypothetical protein
MTSSNEKRIFSEPLTSPDVIGWRERIFKTARYETLVSERPIDLGKCTSWNKFTNTWPGFRLMELILGVIDQQPCMAGSKLVEMVFVTLPNSY